MLFSIIKGKVAPLSENGTYKKMYISVNKIDLIEKLLKVGEEAFS